MKLSSLLSWPSTPWNVSAIAGRRSQTGCKVDVEDSVACLKYYAGFADKIHGNVIEISDQEKSAITRKEPVG